MVIGWSSCSASRTSRNRRRWRSTETGACMSSRCASVFATTKSVGVKAIGEPLIKVEKPEIDGYAPAEIALLKKRAKAFIGSSALPATVATENGCRFKCQAAGVTRAPHATVDGKRTPRSIADAAQKFKGLEAHRQPQNKRMRRRDRQQSGAEQRRQPSGHR